MAIVNTQEILDKVSFELTRILHKKKESLIIEPFYKDFSYRFCWNSNAIEGNTLSLDETISVIDYDEVRSGHKYSEYKDAKCLYKAIMQELSKTPKVITEEWIRTVNGIITDTDGSYRQKNLYVGTVVEATYYPPDYQMVPGQMNRFYKEVNFISEDKAEIIKKVAEQHIIFERIHPFSDGNATQRYQLKTAEQQQTTIYQTFKVFTNSQWKIGMPFLCPETRYNVECCIKSDVLCIFIWLIFSVGFWEENPHISVYYDFFSLDIRELPC